MARRIYFSFHYQRDLWRANVVRNSGAIEGVAAADFLDATLWEETKQKGDHAVKELIDASLDTTTVTVVLVGLQTANREYVAYEIERTIARKHGILGIRINNIKDREGRLDPAGPVPTPLITIDAPIYLWDYGKLGEWVELAYKKASSTV